MTHEEKIKLLRQQGVEIPAPATIEIGDEVQLSAIRGPGTVLHSGTKLYGKDLLILPGARLGYEEPVTVESCAVGPRVKLQGGYFSSSVFFDGVVMGKGAHVRSGTLMEEESNGAHTVGLKQTILLPFVTLGSLINFCDILMAGGTSRKDHSEVGSSFIHFNFTPFGRNGDKATPSLIGDVPHGVMLRSARIFLGGQAGLVGPIHIDFGTVLAAGCVYRRDHGPHQLVIGESLPPRSMPFNPLRYTRIQSKVEKNLRYIGNLVALWCWYEKVRLPLFSSITDLVTLYGRGKQALEVCIKERVQRLGQIATYMEDSIRDLEKDNSSQQEIEHQRAFAQAWPRMEHVLLSYATQDFFSCPSFVELEAGLQRAASATTPLLYIPLIQSLPEETSMAGTQWLSDIVTWALTQSPYREASVQKS